MAGNTPFKLCKQYVHFGGIRNPLVVHWPHGIAASGALRNQFHHAIDVVPTILAAAGVEPPPIVNSVQQAPVEGVPINYSFDDAEAPTTRTTQYFEMLGNRAIIHDGWKAVTFNGRLPWESRSRYENIDEQQWELYNVQDDPAEAHDLLDGKSLGDLDDPMVKKLIELVGMWWAEAGRYNVLPLDDRFNERLLGRGDLYTTREQLTCGRVRGEVSIATRGAPGSGLGTVLLAPAQNGSRMKCTATVEFKVPLVGGKIESFIGRQLVQQISEIQRFTAKWITEHA